MSTLAVLDTYARRINAAKAHWGTLVRLWYKAPDARDRTTDALRNVARTWETLERERRAAVQEYWSGENVP